MSHHKPLDSRYYIPWPKGATTTGMVRNALDARKQGARDEIVHVSIAWFSVYKLVDIIVPKEADSHSNQR